MTPTRLFLDTNVYVLGAADLTTPEGQLLLWAGLESGAGTAELIVSEEVLDQVRRVGRRLHGKDWAGELLTRMWRNLHLVYVVIEPDAWHQLEASGLVIPREDLGVYLTARTGAVQVFVSANHKLIASLVQQTGEFECLTPVEFVQRYLVA